MVVVVAPSTQAVTDHDGPNWALANIPYRQFLPRGTTITWGWASGAQGGGADGFDAAVYDVQTGSAVDLGVTGITWSADSGARGYSVTLTAAADVAMLLFAGGGSGHSSYGTLYGFHAEVTYAPSSWCEYGGQNDPSKSFVWVAGSAIVDLIIGAALAASGQLELLPYVSTAMAALEGTIPFAVDCSVVPSGSPLLDLTNPATVTNANLQAWLQQAAWGWFCQCVPAPAGHSPPQPFVPPPVIAPPDVRHVPAPPVVCDDTAICTFLNHLETLIGALSAQVRYLRADVTLIQRQGVPFGYVTGTIHSALIGRGDFAVSGIVGLAVSFASIPPAHLSRTADPDIYHQVGSISLGTAHGWERSFQPTHSPYLILPISGAITRVGWTFASGVEATITELIREP